MPADQLTNRELFQKLIDVVEKNHDAQAATVKVLQAQSIEMAEMRKLLSNKLWMLLVTLIAALAGTVGIKLVFPAA